MRKSKIYGILSLEPHELDDDDCLSFFPVLRSSIIVILQGRQMEAGGAHTEARTGRVYREIFIPQNARETLAAGEA